MNTSKLKNRLGDKVQALQTETTEGRVISMPNTSLALVNSDYVQSAICVCQRDVTRVDYSQRRILHGYNPSFR